MTLFIQDLNGVSSGCGNVREYVDAELAEVETIVHKRLAAAEENMLGRCDRLDRRLADLTGAVDRLTLLLHDEH